MASIVARLRGVPRDTRLFLAYTLCANIALGTFTLDFNLYLLSLDFREDFIGLASALQTFAMAGTAFMLGGLLGRHGVWRVVVLSLVAFVLLSSLMSLSSHAWMILPVAILWGANTSFLFSTVMPFVVELSDESRRSKVASLTVSTSMVATTIGSLIGGWVPRLVGILMDVERDSVLAFRGALFAGIALAAVGLVPLLLMSQERRLPVVDDDEEDEAPEPGVTPGLPRMPGPTQRRRVIVFTAVGGLMSLGAGMTFPFFNVYLDSIGASPGQIGMIFAGASIFAAGTTLLGPRIVSSLGQERALALGRLSPVPLLLMLIVTPSLGLATLAHLARTASQGLGWSMESTMMSTALRGRARRAIFGYRSGTWNIGYSISSLVGGALIVRWGYDPTFAIYAGFMLIAMTLFYGYFRYVSPVEDSRRIPAGVEEAIVEPVDRPVLRSGRG
ncbi:MAG: MFS transporter [Thermomicrobiales bacterium]